MLITNSTLRDFLGKVPAGKKFPAFVEADFVIMHRNSTMDPTLVLSFVNEK